MSDERYNVGIIEANHWAKVANKTANINVQNRSTLTLRQCHVA